MKPDIATKKDIEQIMAVFYQKARADTLIGFFFTQVIPVRWDRHLPAMCTFWENVLFYSGVYEGDPVTTHRRIHEKYPTRPEHFQRWIQLFSQTIDAFFEGPNAQKMKQHARAIAAVMLQKIEG